MMNFPLVYIGLTGNPGSGKSTALAGFARCGWTVLDADQICAELYRANAAGICDRIRIRWGDGAVDRQGLPNRRRVAEIVFGEERERLWLERQIHPLVRRRARRLALASRTPTVLAVPLLFEAGWRDEFTAVVAVWTREDLRRRRLRRRGWDEREIARRDAAQWPPERKLAEGDLGLINNGRRAELWRQCREICSATISQEKT